MLNNFETSTIDQGVTSPDLTLQKGHSIIQTEQSIPDSTITSCLRTKGYASMVRADNRISFREEDESSINRTDSIVFGGLESEKPETTQPKDRV